MTSLNDLTATRWTGKGELWLDPLGDDPSRYDCTLAIRDGSITYTWTYEGQPQEGSLTLHEGGADFRDTWHQKDGAMRCRDVAGSRALIDVLGSYMETWGWRILLSFRDPTGELVLQMINIAPWGEQARAVRMVLRRDDG